MMLPPIIDSKGELRVRKQIKKENFNRNKYSNELIELVFKMIDIDSKKIPTAKIICQEIEKIIKIKNQCNLNRAQNVNHVENNYVSSLNCVVYILYNIEEIQDFFLNKNKLSNKSINRLDENTNIKQLFKLMSIINKINNGSYDNVL